MGGNGFVGSAIARVCEKENREYVVITRDNYSEFIGKNCDIFINANGNSKKFLANEEPVWEFDASVKSVRASLEDFKYVKYIYLSSCDVYPDCSSVENTSEDMVIDIEKQSTYGFHKHIAEQCVRHVANNWMIFRMGGFVGKGMLKNPIFDIMNDKPLWVDLESELQFINTDDAAEIILSLIDKGFNKEIFNLCGNGLVKLKDITVLLNKNIEVKSNSPKVKYEVNINKISKYTDMPITKKTVADFVLANKEK